MTCASSGERAAIPVVSALRRGHELGHATIHGAAVFGLRQTSKSVSDAWDPRLAAFLTAAPAPCMDIETMACKFAFDVASAGAGGSLGRRDSRRDRARTVSAGSKSRFSMANLRAARQGIKIQSSDERNPMLALGGPRAMAQHAKRNHSKDASKRGCRRAVPRSEQMRGRRFRKNSRSGGALPFGNII